MNRPMRAASARLALVLSALALPGLAMGVDVQGVLHQNTTWTAGNYRLVGDLTVPAGVTLRVEPGVEVVVAAGDGMGSGSDVRKAEVIIAGSMVVRGVQREWPSFRPETPNTDWYGVRVRPGGTLRMSGASVEGAAVGIQVEGGTAHVEGTVLKANDTGIQVYSGQLDLITSLVFDSGREGLRVADEGDATVRRTVFAGGSYGVRVDGGEADLDHVTIAHNSVRGLMLTYDAMVTLTNSIVARNGTMGIVNQNNGVVSGSNNDVWGHNTDAAGTPSDFLFFSSNPLFVDPATHNYRLQENSPCRRAGSDGSDIGSYQYRAP
jgi:hypothetical protein